MCIAESHDVPFAKLKQAHPEVAEELFSKMNRDVQHRMANMISRANGYKEFNRKDEAYHVLFASETGTAQSLARDFADACTMSRTADALNDLEPDDLDGRTTIFFVWPRRLASKWQRFLQSTLYSHCTLF